jgi:hypothetical protein
MSLTAIRSALETQLNAMAPALATAWENAAFVPPAPTVPYQRVDLMLATPENPEIGAGYRELGFMQVTLKYPLQAGPGAAAARAIALRASFPKNLALTSGGVVTTISKTPAISAGVVDGDRWSVPVKIPFHTNVFG